jgi:hypothetical protein
MPRKKRVKKKIKRFNFKILLTIGIIIILLAVLGVYMITNLPVRLRKVVLTDFAYNETDTVQQIEYTVFNNETTESSCYLLLQLSQNKTVVKTLKRDIDILQPMETRQGVFPFEMPYGDTDYSFLVICK